MKPTAFFFKLCTLALLSPLSQALALEGDVEAEPLEPVRFSLGVKGYGGGNYLTPATLVPNSAGSLPFSEGAGGWGAGGGLYLQARVLEDHLGLEVDLFYEQNRNWTQITYNEVVKTDWSYEAQMLRVPVLLHAMFSNESMRGGLGIGPEFVMARQAVAGVDVISGEDFIDPATMNFVNESLAASLQNDTHLCANLGFAFKVPQMAITFDIRYSYNFDQPTDYLDRVAFTSADGPLLATTRSSHTMDLRLMLGFSYDFGTGTLAKPPDQ